MDYASFISPEKTPQAMPLPGENQVKNSAGGFVYEVSDWTRLRRFLILGTEGGTYYASEQKLTLENIKCVQKYLEVDFGRALTEIISVSKEGVAPKNDATIFALALACSVGLLPKDGAALPAQTLEQGKIYDRKRLMAYASIPAVCRTGTHLFTFCKAITQLRGWSRGLRHAVASWYLHKDIATLAYQLVKYRQRDGWTHRDVLRLCHAKSQGLERSKLFRWAAGHAVEQGELPVVVQKYEAVAKKKEVDEEALQLIRQLPVDGGRSHVLPWEALPTHFLKDKRVWEELLHTMPLTALMRNLNKLAVYAGVDSNLSEHARTVADAFTPEAVSMARLHPVKVLEALKTYQAGRGHKGSLTWKPAPRIVDALNEAFYLSFKNTAPTGKRFCIGLDVSGSMTQPISGSFLSCAEVAAAMCMQIARVEENYEIIAFADKPILLNLRPSMPLAEVLAATNRVNFGRTDCSLPILQVGARGLRVDCFQVLTDSETWIGSTHPSVALRGYRKAFSIDAKLIVWGMTATEFSIADPNDPGMLDIAGFDSSAPAIIAEFLGGRV